MTKFIISLIIAVGIVATVRGAYAGTSTPSDPGGEAPTIEDTLECTCAFRSFYIRKKCQFEEPNSENSSPLDIVPAFKCKFGEPVVFPTLNTLKALLESDKPQGPQVATIEAMKNVVTALEAYFVDFVEYPPSLQDLVPGYLFESGLADAWGNTFVYEVATDGQLYTLTSLGSDGVPSGSPPDPWLLGEFLEGDIIFDASQGFSQIPE
jgi:hypothetical protein